MLTSGEHYRAGRLGLAAVGTAGSPFQSSLPRLFRTGPPTRAGILRCTARVLVDLREQGGVEAYLSYGCLLGAVRDGRMIGTDCDADLCHLSERAHAADVFRESYRLGNRSGDLPRTAITPTSTIVLEGVEPPAPAAPEAMWRSSTAPAGGSRTPRSGSPTRPAGCAGSTSG